MLGKVTKNKNAPFQEPLVTYYKQTRRF